jgi:hypothetical protein
MSEVEAQDEAKSQPLPLNLNLVLIVGVVAALIVGGFLLFTGASSASGCTGEGPCMLYFYTDW